MFQSCLPSVFGGGTKDEKENENSIRSVLKMDPSTGALQIPTYTQISRADHCPLLGSAWSQDWNQVVRLCFRQPWRTLHITKYSGRTALHLATFDRQCPLRVARALLKANRQMIAVRDSNNYTPLHIVAFFSAATCVMAAQSSAIAANPTTTTGQAVATNRMGRTMEGDAQAGAANHNNTGVVAEAEAEARSVMSLFCDTAIMVEQELSIARRLHCLEEQEETYQRPLLEGTSPLYLAAKKGAPLSILKILLETRSRTNWIAPSTGGEPYWYDGTATTNTNARSNGAKNHNNKNHGASFSSPLEILLREDRLRSSMNSSYYRNDAFLLGEEEDGNLLRRGRPRNRTNSTNNSRKLKPNHGLRRSPLHPDEILGCFHLIQAMRNIAIDRCRDHYGHGTTNTDENEGCHSHQGAGECGHTARLDNAVVVAAVAATDDSASIVHNDDDTTDDNLFTESQQRCLELWEKCIELLVTAGGGGVPLLLMLTEEEPDSPGVDVVPYGILHACVCCKVPVPSLVEIALLLFPEQVHKRDARHRMIPLHHVLRAEHKYSYATSNLLTILLTGRARVSSVVGSGTRRPSNHRPTTSDPQRTTTAAGEGRQTERMPNVPSLSNSAISHQNAVLQPHSPLPPPHLQSTVLLPFPPENRNASSNTNDQSEERQLQGRRQTKGPIPLVFAIRLGLPMDGVIHQLLEADSHESLRTIDPISQLPPFALVATKIRDFKGEEGRDNISNGGQSSDSNQSSTMPSTALRGRGENSNDIITAAIDSTLNILSSGDASNEFATVTSPSSMPTSGSGKNRNPKNDESASPYKLDDVYRLLSAHPQVLAQYVVD